MATANENANLALNSTFSVRGEEYYSLPERSHILAMTPTVLDSIAKGLDV